MSDKRILPASRLETQARVCAKIVIEVLGEALLSGKPADLCLKDAFSANRQFGARDRRLIGETLFALLRWWGWLRYLAPESFLAAWQNQGAASYIPLNEWHNCLYGAWLLENPTEFPPAVSLWRTSGAPPPIAPAKSSRSGDSGIAERSRALLPMLPPGLTLSTSQLVPEWIWPQLAPEENISEDQLLSWLQRRPPVWLRAQISDVEWLQNQLSADSIPTSRHSHLPFALKIECVSSNLRAQNNFRHGDFEIQDLASQAVALICAPRPGEQWWDACASGGGKTLHLARLMQGKGSVLASDIR